MLYSLKQIVLCKLSIDNVRKNVYTEHSSKLLMKGNSVMNYPSFTPITVRQFVFTCQNKSVDLRIYNDGVEVDYDDPSSYKDLYIVGFNILGELIDGEIPIVCIDASENVEIVQYPYFSSNKN